MVGLGCREFVGDKFGWGEFFFEVRLLWRIWGWGIVVFMWIVVFG